MDPARGSRRPRAPTGARGAEGRRCDRGALARRGRSAGSGPRRVAGSRRARASRARARPARRARRASAAARRRRARGVRRDPRGSRPGAGCRGRRGSRGARGRCVARPRGGVRDRQAGREHPARGHSRDRPGDGKLAGRVVVHRGRPPRRGVRALAVESREPADEPGREHRRDPRGRRPQLHDPRRDGARAPRHRVHDGRCREGVDGLPARGPDLHRRARRATEPPRGNAAAGDGDPAEPVSRVDRRPASRRRLRLGGTRRSRRGRADGVGGRPPQPHGQRRLRRDVHGSRPCRIARRGVECRVRRDRALRRACEEPPRRRAPSRRCTESLGAGLGGHRRRARGGVRPITTGSMRSTTRRSSLRRCTASTATSRARSARRCRAGSIRTRTARRWARCSARSPAGPASRLAGSSRYMVASRPRSRATTARPSTSSRAGRSRLSRNRPGRDAAARAAARPLVATPHRPAARRPARRAPRRARRREDPRRARRPRRLAGLASGADALARGRDRADRLRRIGLRPAGVRMGAPVLLGRARVAVGRDALRPRGGTLHARPVPRRGRRAIRRLRRRRPLARLPVDRDRRAEPVRLLPRRARDPRARRRPPRARRPRVRRLQPVGRRHAARGGRRRGGDRRSRPLARRGRRVPRHDEGGAARPPRRPSTPRGRESASRASRPSR